MQSKTAFGLHFHRIVLLGVVAVHAMPANGGLLYATAMMAAGWDGAPKRNTPGFPDDGRWQVRWENLRPAP